MRMMLDRLARVAAVGVVLFAAGTALAQRGPAGMSDDQVRERIITESVANYHASGRPCACPYDHARNGSSCGGRSAYSRPGGAAPLCYPRDVSAGMVTAWRRDHH